VLRIKQADEFAAVPVPDRTLALRTGPRQSLSTEFVDKPVDKLRGAAALAGQIGRNFAGANCLSVRCRARFKQ
jgi:hypothetical protein